MAGKNAHRGRREMRSDRLLIASDISLPFFFLFFPLILIVVYRMAIRYLIAILNRLNILDRALFQPKAFFFFFFGILILIVVYQMNG